MADGKFIEAKTETKVIEVKPAKVVLTMTEEEAKWLKGVMGKFIGRGISYEIYKNIPVDTRGGDIVRTGTYGGGNQRVDGPFDYEEYK